MGALLEAQAAFGGTDTLPFVKGQFGVELLRFRVAAPAAAQGTPLEEHQGTDARAIVEGIALNVEYQPGSAIERCVLRQLIFLAEKVLSAGC